MNGSGSIARRPQGRRSRRRDETRDELLVVMQRLLESGVSYSQISVERLATEAGMSRTRFYMYFEDMADLLYSAYVRVIAEGKKIVANWWEDDGPIERDRMRRILGELIRYRAEHLMVSKAVRACVATDAIARSSVDEVKWQSVEELQAAIEAGQRSGAIDAELEAPVIAGWLGWMLERAVDQLVEDSRPAHLRKVADSLTTIIWNTLYGRQR
jgi:TetR/AcrR family transcriptional regulator, ethionamide resistance regulator